MLLPLLPKSFPPLLSSYQLKKTTSILIGEVSFMLFLICKQQEGVGRETKSLSWRRLFWMNPVWKLRMLFSQFVKPRNTIPPFITKLTSITNEDVATAESFPAVGDAFIQFMQQHADKYEDNEEVPPVEKIILVGHNGKVFDMSSLIHQLSEHGIADRLFQDGRFSLGIDTLNVARKGVCSDKSAIWCAIGVHFSNIVPVCDRIAAVDMASCNG
jgi:DNA polymerase III epsilon subunit-like protein